MVTDMIFFYTILAGFVNQSLCTNDRPEWVEVPHHFKSNDVDLVDSLYARFHTQGDWSPAVPDVSGTIWDTYLRAGVDQLLIKIKAVPPDQDLDTISREASDIILPLIYSNMVMLDDCKKGATVQHFGRYLNEIDSHYLELASTQYLAYFTRPEPLPAEYYLVALTVLSLINEEMTTHLLKASRFGSNIFTHYRGMIDNVRTAMVLKFKDRRRLAKRLAKLQTAVNGLQPDPEMDRLRTQTVDMIEQFGMETLMIVATVGTKTMKPEKAMSELLNRVGEIQIVLNPGLVTINTPQSNGRYNLIRGLGKYLEERHTLQPKDRSIQSLGTTSNILLTKLQSLGDLNIDP